MSLAGGAAFAVFAVLMGWAAVKDAASYTIPNWISLALIAAFALAALALGAPPRVIATCVATGAVVLALGFALFALNWFGGGDVKLFAATSLWFGWPGVSTLLIFTTIAGGVLALALMLLRSKGVSPKVAGPAWLVRLAAPGRQMPYGVAIAAGAVAGWPLALISGPF